MTIRSALAVLLFAAALPAAAHAACPAQSTSAIDLESGASTSAVSNDRRSWNGRYVLASIRGANNDAVYGRASHEERFGAADDAYETGAYLRFARRATLGLIAATSPQHHVLPQSVLGASLDLRAGAGLGYQVGFAERTYDEQRAAVVTAGADRYSGDSRVALLVTLARLSNVPGLAMTETLQTARFLPCDTLGTSLSIGRDVENLGSGSRVAVYPTLSLDVNDLHWLSDRTALNAGVGWSALGGVYSRLEVRIALHRRF